MFVEKGRGREHKGRLIDTRRDMSISGRSLDDVLRWKGGRNENGSQMRDQRCFQCGVHGARNGTD